MVDGVEEELNEIVRNTTDDNRDAPRIYEEFIARHSGSLLHANHYLLMTAKRNLIQFYTYATPTSEILDLQTVRGKLEHCQHFYNVLTKVGPKTNSPKSATVLLPCRVTEYKRFIPRFRLMSSEIDGVCRQLFIHQILLSD